MSNMDDAPDEDLSGMNLSLNVAAVVMQETAMSDSENRGTPCSSSPPVVAHYPYCNFPLTYSPMLQQAFTHHARFAEFLIATDHPPAAARVLFKKELTPSDVGKLNRLVIPKKCAVRYFPEMQCTSSSSSSSINKDVIVNNDEGTMLEFRDREGELWVFRYCYWRSSQSFVFTKGWNKFVKAKQLCSRDTVAFYTCDERRSGRKYFVIDAHYTSREEYGREEEAAMVNDRSASRGEEQEEGSGGMRKKNGFKLFGTFIEPATTN